MVHSAIHQIPEKPTKNQPIFRLHKTRPWPHTFCLAAPRFWSNTFDNGVRCSMTLGSHFDTIEESLEPTHSTMFSEQFLREGQQLNDRLDTVRPP